MPSPLNIRGTLAGLLTPRMDAAPAPPPVVSEPRADSATTSRGAGVANTLSTLGAARDSGASARPNLNREPLSDEELVALYATTPLGRIVDILPKWATRKGITITDTGEDADPLRQERKALGLMRKVREAATWARALGEGAIWISVDDGRPLDQPLDPSRVRRVHALHVLDKRDFTPMRWEGDPKSLEWGEPSHYLVHPQRMVPLAHEQPLIHASRLRVFHGHRLPPSARASRDAGRSQSIGQRLWDSLRNLEQMGAAGARAAQELSVALFQIGSLESKQGGDHRTTLVQSLQAINIAKSLANAVVLGTGDNYSRIPLNPSGFKDLSEFAQRHLAMVEGIPLVLLFGQTPAGLSTDGESWFRNWAASVEDFQESDLLEHVSFIVRCLYYATAGEEPESWEVTFNPLQTISEKEKAEIRQLHTAADSQAILDGVLSPDRVARSRYGADGWSNEIQPETEEEEAEELETTATDSRLDARAPLRFKVPKAVQSNAALGIELSKEHGVGLPPNPKGGMGTGKRTAQRLTSGEVDEEQIVLMAAWLARHGEQLDRRRSGWENREEPSAEWVSWLGWGGDEAVPWVRASMKQIKAARGDSAALELVSSAQARLDEVAPRSAVVWLPVPPTAEERLYGPAQAAAEKVLGPMANEGPRHLTLLYLGQLTPEQATEAAAIVQDVATSARPFEVRPGATVPLGADGAIVQEAACWDARELNDRLLRRLAHLVSAPQYPTFRPHVTLGYAPSATPGQLADVLEAAPSYATEDAPMWSATRMELVVGAEVVGVFPLLGRRQDAAREEE